MPRERYPVTRATRQLRAAGVEFTQHLYAYEERGGTAVAARELGLDEHATIKTLVLEEDKGTPLLVLMHGDREVSTKSLARCLGAKNVAPCTPEVAQRHTGYLVGGTSPFGTRHPLPVYVQRSVLDLPTVYINGGKRGYLVGIEPRIIDDLLHAAPVDVAIAPADRDKP